MNYDSSWQLYQSRRILTKYGEDLTEAERDVIEDVMDTLHKLMVSREYFKTLYYKLEPGVFPDVSFFGYTPLTVFISLAYTIALAPYAVLTSYVLRAAAVTKRTPEEGPFVFVLDGDRETASDERHEY